jgi:hypothetical protein
VTDATAAGNDRPARRALRPIFLPGGGTQALSTMHVRLTEYTVGANGPAAMPASYRR